MSSRAVAIARGDDAARRLRARVRKAVSGTCANCRFAFLPSAVDIDHIVPLSRGGEDVASNVQVLCRPCHKAKTRTDMGFTKPPF